VIFVDRARWFSARQIGHDAGPAGLDEGLPGTLDRGEHRFDRRAIVSVGCVDDRVGLKRCPCEHFEIAQRSQHRLDASLSHL
jgi:hypothetical protein